ncbi:bud neck involved protein [Ophidiomyces ophidiicola]|nr:bud neck involved protein [Ophidiomyces ophidiicola]KAI1966512.1 bud neck involved protein [Ophidiomyces ophidiicola]KAI2032186.1 bud neck involved protein [Ophidiomyces ophidiicola]KAI2042908.1 bud neck involved protein [Ophidiomyces ophidiicola]KAI2070374.1 bud neck involved protein [Ophidiomyces ophidiicola]
MAALVQTIPQQATTITLLHSRPASSSGTSQLQQQQSQQQHQMARNTSNTRQSYGGVAPITGYRNAPSSAGNPPVAPYAFTSTPSLANAANPPSQPRPNSLMKGDNLTTSTPIPSQADSNPPYPGVIPSRTHFHHAAGSVSTNSSASVTSSIHSTRSKDDSALPPRHVKTERAPRPLSTLDLSLPPLTLSPPASSPAFPKPSPDRYRRTQRRPDPINLSAPSTNASSTVAAAPLSPSASPDAELGEKYPALSFSPPQLPELTTSFVQHSRNASADAAPAPEKATPELAKRYRRRSLGSLDNGLASLTTPESSSSSKSLLDAVETSTQSKLGVSQAPSSNSQDNVGPTTRSPISADSQFSNSKQDSKPANPTNLRPTVEVSKRPGTSPLSQSAVIDSNATSDRVESKLPETSSEQPKFQSPAAKRLIELSKKGGKGGKSRLRRALSFSSVAELRGASAPDSPSMTRKQQLDEELGAEQAAIAQKQEASGLGENIYSGQGHFFTGSTDNISVSSTASSASIMLRKMGKGVKRSTRSLVGLFRPKSLHNVSLESSRVEPTMPQVSRVTVEAQRETSTSVITETPGVRAVDRISEDSALSKNATEQNDVLRSRKSILGGDKERAEVLAAVKKGILKSMRNTPLPLHFAATDTPTETLPGGSSPVMRPSEAHFTESPRSSAPSTPRDERPPRSGHRRTDSVTIEGDEYFLPGGRFNAVRANSAPATPQNSAKNISFSPRIQFHDTWPSGEYDRRGDIATCNRLTPLLAQQIKEELNTFKMEMEVHESSKVYTHFF